MWDGKFSLSLEKAGVSQVKWEKLDDDDDPFNTYEYEEVEVDDSAFLGDEFDDEATLEIENRNPSSSAKKNWKDDSMPEGQRGILWANFGIKSPWYGFPATFAQYKAFETSGFSRRWINETYGINYVGDWGWPYGRVE